MEDAQIVELYWNRSQRAVSETAAKYGGYCLSIARGILENREDAEESVNDAYLAAWNSMPPHRPAVLSAFLGKLTRRISIDRWRGRSAEKRGGGRMDVALAELEDCLPAADEAERTVDRIVLTEALERFLDSLSPEVRRIFLRRYWYLRSVREIAAEMHTGESRVKMSLLRARNKLKACLEKEGIAL